MKFTGFMETTGEGQRLLLTTVGPVELDDLVQRLRTRIAELPPGTSVRIDLIAWGEPE